MDPRFAGKRKEKITGEEEGSILSYPFTIFTCKEVGNGLPGKRKEEVANPEGSFCARIFYPLQRRSSIAMWRLIDVASSRLLTQRSATGWKTLLDRKTPSKPKEPSKDEVRESGS